MCSVILPIRALWHIVHCTMYLYIINYYTILYAHCTMYTLYNVCIISYDTCYKVYTIHYTYYLLSCLLKVKVGERSCGVVNYVKGKNVYRLRCPSGTVGSVVTVYQKNNYLTLCEVQILGF